MALKKWKAKFHCGHLNWNAKKLEDICETPTCKIIVRRCNFELGVMGKENACKHPQSHCLVLNFFVKRTMAEPWNILGCVAWFFSTPLPYWVSESNETLLQIKCRMTELGSVTLPCHQPGHSLCREVMWSSAFMGTWLLWRHQQCSLLPLCPHKASSSATGRPHSQTPGTFQPQHFFAKFFPFSSSIYLPSDKEVI